MKKNVKFSVIGLMSIGLLLGACGNDDDNDTVTAACQAPTNLISDATSANSVSFSWDANNASAWTVEYGETGYTPGSGTSVTVSNNSATIEGLESSQSYDVYVTANCDASNSSVAGPLTLTTNNPIVGEWGTYDPSALMTGSGIDSISAIFNSNFTYEVKSYSNGASNTYEGTYVTSTDPSAEGIYSITVNQSSPNTLTSEGIFQVFPANPDSMWYEVAQTDPAITGVTPANANDGFGSTSGGAFGMMNIQKYLRVE